MSLRQALQVDESFVLDEFRARTPEERLMAAVLEEALVTFARGLRSRDPLVRQASREVDEWVRSSAEADLFSFESICGHLGLDTDCVRARCAAMRRDARLEPRPKSFLKRYRRRVTGRRAWRGRIG